MGESSRSEKRARPGRALLERGPRQLAEVAANIAACRTSAAGSAAALAIASETSPRARPGAARPSAARTGTAARAASARSNRARRPRGPPLRRAPARSLARAWQRRVEAGERQRLPHRGPARHRRLQGPPAEPDPALRQGAGQVERDERASLSRGLAQQIGDQRDLLGFSRGAQAATARRGRRGTRATTGPRAPPDPPPASVLRAASVASTPSRIAAARAASVSASSPVARRKASSSKPGG